jgi:hypothetical protein
MGVNAKTGDTVTPYIRLMRDEYLGFPPGTVVTVRTQNSTYELVRVGGGHDTVTRVRPRAHVVRTGRLSHDVERGKSLRLELPGGEQEFATSAVKSIAVRLP